VDAWGGEDDWEGVTEPEPKKSPLCASWLILEETSRPPLEVVAPELPPPAAPGWAPRARAATTPKPTAAAPTEASFTT
jgi:hypothetical protein